MEAFLLPIESMNECLCYFLPNSLTFKYITAKYLSLVFFDFKSVNTNLKYLTNILSNIRNPLENFKRVVARINLIGIPLYTKTFRNRQRPSYILIYKYMASKQQKLKHLCSLKEKSKLSKTFRN